MTPAKKWLQKVLEKAASKFYEGPEPPKRIWEQVRLFKMATRPDDIDAWEDFAVEFAQACYRDGWQRGFEWAERDLDARPKDDPDVLAEQIRHAWSLSDDPKIASALEAGIDPTDPLAGVSEEHRAFLLDELGQLSGGYRVVMDDPKKSSEK